MSVAYNSKITTTGLIMYLDAANIKSYTPPDQMWIDLKGNNDGALINSATFSPNNSGYFTFNASTQYVDCGPTPLLGPSLSGLTISMWFYPTTNNTRMLAENGSSFTSNTFYLAQENSTSLSFAVANPQGSYQRIFGSTNYQINRWYNFVGVWKSGLPIQAYLNGVETSSGLLSPSGNLTQLRSGNTNLFLARIPAGALYFAGNISNFSMYNRALTDDEIFNNFVALRGRFGV